MESVVQMEIIRGIHQPFREFTVDAVVPNEVVKDGMTAIAAWRD